MKNLLSYPVLFNLFQKLVSKNNSQELFVKKYIKPNNSDNILDLGCGTGQIIDYLPEGINYTGIDISHNYIKYAQNRYVDGYNFICKNILDIDFSTLGVFDIVIASGFFHHLDDKTIYKILQNLQSCIKNESKLISIDPCFVDNQNWISKLLVSNDRGEYVRNKEGYVGSLNKNFNKVDAFVHNDLLKIPYNHCICRCSDIVDSL